MTKRIPAFSLLLLTGLMVVGCSKPADTRPERAAVHGMVTFQGEALSRGSIQFFPTDGNGFQAFGVIEEGKYSIPRESGPSVVNCVVRITAHKKTGRKIETEKGPEEETKQYLPENYNKNSELSANIQAGENSFDFNLK